MVAHYSNINFIPRAYREHEAKISGSFIRLLTNTATCEGRQEPLQFYYPVMTPCLADIILLFPLFTYQRMHSFPSLALPPVYRAVYHINCIKSNSSCCS